MLCVSTCKLEQQLTATVVCLRKEEDWITAASIVAQIAKFSFDGLAMYYLVTEGYEENEGLKTYVKALSRHLEEHLREGSFEKDALPILSALRNKPESLASVMNLFIERFSRVSARYGKYVTPEDYETEIHKIFSQASYITQMNKQTQKIINWDKVLVQKDADLWNQKKLQPIIHKIKTSILQANPDQKLLLCPNLNNQLPVMAAQPNSMSPLQEGGYSQTATRQRILEIASQQGM